MQSRGKFNTRYLRGMSRREVILEVEMRDELREGITGLFRDRREAATGPKITETGSTIPPQIVLERRWTTRCSQRTMFELGSSRQYP